MASLIDLNKLVNSHKQKTEKTNSGNEKTNTIKNTKMSLAESHPELAEQWHPTKNGNLKPTNVTAGSDKKVWWYLPYDDPKTNKHFDFEWQATISSRCQGVGCPYLSNPVKAIWIGFNDLATTHPELAAQWHPTKNGDLKPTDITFGSGIKVWWYLPYDDPTTGKHFDFEWQSLITTRINNKGCPYLSNPAKAVWIGFNDLATTHPELASEWHPTKNRNLMPTEVTAGSSKKVWWKCETYGHVWTTSIAHRTNDNTNCPYCSNQKTLTGFNDLASTHPSLLEEWDYEKNTILPTDITAGSQQKVWWICSKCKKHWKTTPSHRTRENTGCPHCSSFGTSTREQFIYYYISKIFPDAKNKSKENKPNWLNRMELDIVLFDKKIAIEYDGQAWHKNVKNDEQKSYACLENGWLLIRVRENGCPTLNTSDIILWVDAYSQDDLKNAILKIINICGVSNIDSEKLFKDEFIYNKEVPNNLLKNNSKLLEEWDYEKNTIKPESVSINSGKKFWWKCKKCGQSWESVVYNRTNYNVDCPYCANKKITAGINDFESWCHNNNKEFLLDEWDYKKNTIMPNEIGAGSQRDIAWKCNSYNHEWTVSVYRRTQANSNCPYCAKQKILVGFNDLATTHPELAAEWHPTKNGNLKPTDVVTGSGKKVWWLYSYDDPETGKHFDFEWAMRIDSRTERGNGCPFLSGHAVWVGFNDLATTHPELAAEWHPTKNGDLKPTDVTFGSGIKAWWYLPYDDPKTGKHFDFEWQAAIEVRCRRSLGCPYLSGRLIMIGFNDLVTTHPQLCENWNYEKNIILPTDITAGSSKKIWWKCKKCGYEWNSKINNNTRVKCPCPNCRKSSSSRNSLV